MQIVSGRENIKHKWFISGFPSFKINFIPFFLCLCLVVEIMDYLQREKKHLHFLACSLGELSLFTENHSILLFTFIKSLNPLTSLHCLVNKLRFNHFFFKFMSSKFSSQLEDLHILGSSITTINN